MILRGGKVLFRGARAAEEVFQLYRGTGCDKCGGKGFLGRTGIFELLVLDDSCGKSCGETDAQSMKALAVSRG